MKRQSSLFIGEIKRMGSHSSSRDVHYQWGVGAEKSTEQTTDTTVHNLFWNWTMSESTLLLQDYTFVSVSSLKSWACYQSLLFHTALLLCGVLALPAWCPMAYLKNFSSYWDKNLVELTSQYEKIDKTFQYCSAGDRASTSYSDMYEKIQKKLVKVMPSREKVEPGRN